MNRSNYRFVFNPGEDVHGFGIEITSKFREFLLGQKVDVEFYQRRVLRYIKEIMNLDPSLYHERFCDFEGGLLTRVSVPGRAAGLSLEHRGDFWEYCPFNIDGILQERALFAFMMKYLSLMEDRITILETPKSITVNTGDEQELRNQSEEFIRAVYRHIQEELKLPSGKGMHPSFNLEEHGLCHPNGEATDGGIMYLKYQDGVVASVIRTRTEFNYVRYDFFLNLENIS